MAKLRYKYVGYITLSSGVERFTAIARSSRKQALLDAALTIDEVRRDPDCQWRNSIVSYGTCYAWEEMNKTIQR